LQLGWQASSYSLSFPSPREKWLTGKQH